MLKLIEACEEYANELKTFREEILANDPVDENQFAGCMGLSAFENVSDWIRVCNLRKNEDTCEQAGTNVPSTTYFAIREEDHKLVGVIDLRHHIDHPILGTWGGHTGYSVRPTERGKGYAKEMLRLNIENAKRMGIPVILVTCSADNSASEKTILDCGGRYENTVDVDGLQVKRYWIKTGA